MILQKQSQESLDALHNVQFRILQYLLFVCIS